MKNETVGVVIIGRNEGERLKRAIEAIDRSSVMIVYVDSDSSDGSPQLARFAGVEVVELDPSIPFCAARARNAGFDRLIEIHPETSLVQFLDGDCELHSTWIETGIRAMESNPDVAAVCGRRRERFPGASLYNRIIDDEWNTPVGPALSCGGDSLMRVSAFNACGGFDATIAAGEEPELCHRLRSKGYRLQRLDAEMSLHDAAISNFSQWWRRHIRSGYGGRDVQKRFSVEVFDRELRSARIWTLAWMTMTLAALLTGYALDGGVGFAIAATICGIIWIIQAWRISRGYRRRGLQGFAAAKAGVVTMLIKWANLLGQFRHWRDSRSGRHAELIEYKGQSEVAHQSAVSAS